MTNTHLWFAISGPSILALIGILVNLKGVSELSHRLVRIGDRLLNLLVDHESRIAKVEIRVEPKEAVATADFRRRSRTPA